MKSSLGPYSFLRHRTATPQSIQTVCIAKHAGDGVENMLFNKTRADWVGIKNQNRSHFRSGDLLCWVRGEKKDLFNELWFVQ